MMMMSVSMSPPIVLVWVGWGSRAGYSRPRPGSVSTILSAWSLPVAFAWSPLPSFVRRRLPLTLPAACLTRPLAWSTYLSDILGQRDSIGPVRRCRGNPPLLIGAKLPGRARLSGRPANLIDDNRSMKKESGYV